jgi:hypothetical protein
VPPCPACPAWCWGRTPASAWGFTNTGPDVQDLYIEEVVPTSPPRYRTPEGTAAFERFGGDHPCTGRRRGEARRAPHPPRAGDLRCRRRWMTPLGARPRAGDALDGPRRRQRRHGQPAGDDARHLRARLRRRPRRTGWRRCRTWSWPTPMARSAFVAAGRVPRARPRQRPAGPRPGTGLGGARTTGRAGCPRRRRRANATRARLDRHREPAHPRTRLPPLPGQRLEPVVPPAAHRAAAGGAGRVTRSRTWPACRPMCARWPPCACCPGCSGPAPRTPGRSGAERARRLRRHAWPPTAPRRWSSGPGSARWHARCWPTRWRNALFDAQLRPYLPGHARGHPGARRRLVVRRQDDPCGRDLRAAGRPRAGCGAR